MGLRITNKSLLTERPSGTKRFDYNSWWIWIRENLLQLLFEDSQMGHKQEKLSLIQMLDSAKKNYEDQNESGAYDLSQIIWLIEDLDFLRQNDHDSFNDFKKKLVSNVAREYHYLTGTWFEIRITRLLNENGFRFNRPDPPDFSVAFENSTINIECYAPRLIDKEPAKKLLEAIHKKNRKYKGAKWIEERSILFLDITWLMRARNTREIRGQEMMTEDFVESLIKGYEAGSYKVILCFIFGHTFDGIDNLSTTCRWVPGSIRDKKLSEFIETIMGEFNCQDDLVIRLSDMPS